MTNHEEYLALNERGEGNDVLTNSDSPSRSRNRPLYGQIMVALAGYGTTLTVGFTAGFSGVLLHQLQSNSSDLQVDDNMASWIVSIYTGATSIGCFLSGFIMNFTGRRITVLMGISFLTIGWIFIALSKSHAIMLLGRAIDGFGRGNIALSVTIHQDEMADPRLRTTLITCCLLTFSIGVVIITALRTTLDWRIAAGICGALSFVAFVAYYFVPESPVWLVRNGKVQKAREVFKWLWNHHHDEEAEEDLQELLNRLKEETEERQVSWQSKLRDCLKAQYIKPFLIMHIANLLLVLCGPHLIIFYASEILTKLNKTGELDLTYMLIFSSSVRVVAMVLTCFLLLWFCRRPLCITSAIVSGLSTLCIAIATTMNVFHSWFLFVLMIIYIMFSTFGLLTVVPILSSEAMPSKIRSVACAYMFTMDDVGTFIFTKAFHSIVNGVGIHAFFWILACSCLVCSCYLYLLLPETKDRTLVEIEKYFAQKNILWIKRQKTNQCGNSHFSSNLNQLS